MKTIILLFAIILVSCTKIEQEPTNFQISDRSNFTISGKVIWEHDDVSGVKNVTVNLTGSETQSTLTDSLGNYSFSVSTDGNYTITPTKQINQLNGCTNADVTLIQKHLLHNPDITDPYKLIAADINHNNIVNAQDATYLLQSILGNPTALALFNKYWRFTPNFSLTLPPWGFSEKIDLINISSDTLTNNFVGIKVGDLNGSANPQL